MGTEYTDVANEPNTDGLTAHAPEDPSGLNAKQERFCQEYLLDLNAAQAAIRAGYSESSAKQIGHQLLSRDGVAERVAELARARSERTKIDADYVLYKIRETVERCSQGEPVMQFDPVDKVMKPTGEWKFEAPSVLKGCELLGKHLKLFTDKHEHSGPNGGPIPVQNLTDEQLDAKLAQLLAKEVKE